VDELGLLYIALARLFDKPAEAVKLTDEITSLAESLGVDGFAEFFKEAAALDLEGHRLEMFELAPRCPPYGGYHALGEDNKERGWYIHHILTYYRAFGLELDVKKEQRGRGVSGLPRRGEKNLGLFRVGRRLWVG
jgi:nitrate reductase delta subunit